MSLTRYAEAVSPPAGDMAFDALRAGFTASVSHELRTPLARILVLLDNAVLTGADDGIGVAEADLPRLFERFWRADAARATRGTGLGLAIVKHVVTAAGGSVEATGSRGRGLQVRCSFPTR